MTQSYRARLLAASTLALVSGPALAQQVAESADPDVVEVEAVVVTGSRIPRQDLEGAAPVTVIKAETLDANGFRSVFDALTQATQNTGSVQGEDFGSTFTPAANFVSLRGLGPNHTLVLINGRRVAEYPTAYNGSVNAVNLANVPSAMVDQIEILTGGAGAIYGSDAIAGVVNLKLKNRIDGADLSLRYGGTEQGGGENFRAQLSGGRSWGDLDVVAGAEFSTREPIFWGQREISESYIRHARPGTVPPAMFSNRDPLGRRPYYAPDAGVCESLADLQGGSIVRVAPASGGAYCGSDGFYNYRTIQTEKEAASAYLGLTYRLNDDVELFGDFLYGRASIANVVRSLSWSRTFWNDTSGRLETWSRVLTPEETGGAFGTASTYDEDTWNLTFGARGELGERWRYEAAYNRSEYVSDQGRVRLLASIDGFFRGPQLGTRTVSGATQPVFAPAVSRLYTPLTPDEFRQHSATFRERDSSYLQDFSVSLNGELFTLPAGPVEAALVAEAGDQGFRNGVDPRLAQGVAWNTTAALPSSGHRLRQAASVELRLPLLDSLTATVAGRYDRYSYRGETASSPTYAVGLQYRPVKSLLARASYATSFRAPDMNYLFAQETRGYYPLVTDYYQCRLDGQPYSGCDIRYNMNFVERGAPGLQPEEGTSFTAGFVWTPNRRFDLRLDYYDLEISDQVTSLSEELILRTEADCRLGVTPGGAAVDPASAVCRDYVGRVTRNPSGAPINPNQVTEIAVNPINAARERTRGIDAAANLRWALDSYGEVTAGVGYTKVLEHTYQQFAGDPVVDYLGDLSRQQDWRDRANATVGWEVGPWTASLYAIRYGAIPRNDYAGVIPSYTVVNGSVRYRLNDRTSVSLTGANLGDAYPVDTSGGWPNYSIGWHDIYGRQVWFQLDYRFD